MSNEHIPASLPLNIDVESKAILRQLTRSHAALAELKGVARTIPNQTILINAITLQEAKDSSEIENIVTTHDELYRAGVESKNASQEAKEVQQYRQALYTGWQRVYETKLILLKDLLAIHLELEDNDAGFRTQSGTALKNERTGEVVYMPPQNAQTIVELMGNLEYYINTPEVEDLDPLVKMAIIHHQFESIHPFYDGNGRTGRIINILYLVQNGLLDLPILYLSRYIIRNKSDYYRLLQEVRTKSAWEEWILYMLKGIEETAVESLKLVLDIGVLMETTQNSMRESLPKIYSKDLLELLFMQPYTKISFVIDRLSVTRKTASQYLKELEKVGILQGVKIGREVYYINQPLFSLLREKINK